MLDVLSSTKSIFENLAEVKIIPERIDQLIEKIKVTDLKTPEISYTKHFWDHKDLIRLIFLFNTVNFCYWAVKGKLKWTVEIDGEKMDGAIALFRSLETTLKNNPTFSEGKTLENLTLPELRNIIKGNVEIPLLKERLSCLNEAGRVLLKKFKGDFLNVLSRSGDNALKLTEILIDNFPSFNDISQYEGKILAFYKRAQLNSKMINDALISADRKPLGSLDKLTAFADYKVPQILRKLEVLEYSRDLAGKIDNFQIISPNSKEEIEIRTATIWGVEKIKEKLKPKYPFVTSSHIGSLLWNFSQVKTPDDKPYHRTYTTAY